MNRPFKIGTCTKCERVVGNFDGKYDSWQILGDNRSEFPCSHPVVIHIHKPKFIGDPEEV